MKTFASTLAFPSLPPLPPVRVAAPSPAGLDTAGPSVTGRNRVAVCWRAGTRRQRA